MIQGGTILEYTDQAGVQTPQTDIYNDIVVLSTSQNFFSNYKLHLIKLWSFQEGPIVGMEQQFINPDTNELLCPGPHIGYAYNDWVVVSELLLDFDEYIQDVTGSAINQIDYLHMRTNKGNYIEFGKENGRNQFRFRIPQHHAIFSFTIGLDQHLQCIGIQTIPIEHYQIKESQKIYQPIVIASPQLIKRSIVVQTTKNTKMIFKDDFWALRLHPHIKSKSCKITQISCCYSNIIEGLDIQYQIGQKFEQSSYNYCMQSHQVQSLLQIESGDYLHSISGTRNGPTIHSLTLKTFKGQEIFWGINRGKSFDMQIPDECEVLAFKIGFSNKGLHSLMVYYI